jgi:cyclase
MLCVMRRTSALRLTVAVLLSGGGVWVAYAHGQQFGAQPATLNLVKISDDLYVLHNDFVPGNSTALITDEGVVLVDDKFAVDHDTIVSELKKVTSKPIRYVINTHHHADHAGGNAMMQQMAAQVVVSQPARDNLATAARDSQWSVPNIAFEGHLSIRLGGKRVELYHFGRGHTNGDVVVYFPAARTLVAGDLLVTDPTTPQLIDYAAGGSAKEWTTTLDSALQLDFDTAVPGHGNVTTKQAMRNFRETTIVLRNRVHEMIMQKRTRDDIAKMLQSDFHWVGVAGQVLMTQSFDGLIGELQ